MILIGVYQTCKIFFPFLFNTEQYFWCKVVDLAQACLFPSLLKSQYMIANKSTHKMERVGEEKLLKRIPVNF